MPDEFPNTGWTVIHQVQGLSDSHAARRECLSKMAERYQGPVRAMMRAWGLRDEHELDDASQAFFLDFLSKNWLDRLSREKGRFRGFLRASIHHFLVDRKRRDRRPAASLEAGEEPPDDAATPDQAFDRAWARQIMDRAVAGFRAECAARDLLRWWTVFERHVLGEENPSLRETASLISATPKEAAGCLHRARARFAELVRELVAETVGAAADIDDEMECLRRSL